MRQSSYAGCVFIFGKRSKTICRNFLVVAIAVFLVTLGMNLFVLITTNKLIFHELADLPQRRFALVLGTEPLRPDGSTNLHFLKRTDLAAKLYLSGKVSYLLISGNKNNRGFNEVLEMKKRIVAEGVPEAKIQLDFEGKRTYESIRHAKEIYHLDKIIIVTDSFHAPRAIYLCHHFGIDAFAICPEKDPVSYWFVKYEVKEYFARVLAMFDVLVLSHHEAS